MGALKAGSKLVLYRLAVFLSLSVAFFSHDHHKLHAARFARLHELSQLSSPNLEDLGTSLLLGHYLLQPLRLCPTHRDTLRAG